ncbi:MAG: zinc-dependent metalloprotease [Actinobacteria bacterium]|nr:zinc-dependent metalloprotease [Actinomycetota bacterium]MBO0834450.1 zinc-dependent metalloprotease [Actinomycetota bacterium]
MTEPPFGFGPPAGSGSGRDPGQPGGGGGGGGAGEGGPPSPFGPLGPMGDPQQFAEALRQFADLMAWQGGPVNWDLAKNIARQTVAQKGDASVLDSDRRKVVEALRLADLWLEETTQLPSGIQTATAWSRSEWVEATLPVWSKLCDPIAARAVDAMSGLLSEDSGGLAGELPPEMQAMVSGLGGFGGLAEMMRRIGGMMVGGQAGAAVGALADEVVSATDIGLPLGPAGTAALLPAGVAAFGAGLSVDPDEVRLFLALREAAHHRLFGHVPWLRSRMLGAVEDYARGIKVDATALRDAMPQIDPSNPEALNEALSGAALFQPEDTPEQKAALVRLETVLALVEGWVATVVAAAAADRLPQATALAEAIRRRRATGGPAERTFATLVGLELRPRRLREAAAIWAGLTEERGVAGRDAIWSHPDLLPTADDFDDPDAFVRGRPELDISDLDELKPGQDDSDTTGPADEDE